MKRVLVIDDEPQIRNAVSKILQRAGFESETAENGNQGLKIFNSKSFDLVITDLTMPEKDGMETINELVKINPGLHIIAMSGGGYRFPEYFLDKATDTGAKLSLKKPIRAKELIDAVESLIGSGSGFEIKSANS